MLSVCLFVLCLTTTSSKIYLLDLCEIMPEMYPWSRNSPLNSGRHAALRPDLGIFPVNNFYHCGMMGAVQRNVDDNLRSC